MMTRRGFFGRLATVGAALCMPWQRGQFFKVGDVLSIVGQTVSQPRRIGEIITIRIPARYRVTADLTSD